MYTIPQLLKFMKDNDAEDLYLTVNRAPSFKIHGAVRQAGKVPLDAAIITEMIKVVLDEQQYNELVAKKELNTPHFDPEIGRFRFNFYWQKSRPAVVVRKIETIIKTLVDLKLPPVLRDV